MMSKLLINEPPLQVLPSLAIKVGLNEAIILQQFHYWLERSQQVRDGETWIYNTVSEWQEQFPFWSVATVRRAINNLRESGIVVTSDEYNKMKIDKTLWYRIDYAALNALTNADSNIPCDQNEHSSYADCVITFDQNDHTNNQRLTETTQEKPTSTDDGDDKPSSALSAEQEKQWTAAIATKLESVGVGLTAFMLDEYMDVAKEHGIEATVRGITAAAQNGKAKVFKYVLACIRNIADGSQPVGPSTPDPKAIHTINFGANPW